MAGRTAAGPGSAQVQDREARDLGAPVGTPRLPDVGRGGARRGHTPSPDSAPTLPWLAEAAAVCGALSRSSCSVSIGASVVAAGLGHSDPKVISLFYSFCPGSGASRYSASPRGMCILVSCPGFAWPFLPPTPHPWHPTQYLWLPGPLLNSGFAFFCRDPAWESVPFKPDQVFSSQGRSIFFGPRWGKEELAVTFALSWRLQPWPEWQHPRWAVWC